MHGYRSLKQALLSLQLEKACGVSGNRQHHSGSQTKAARVRGGGGPGPSSAPLPAPPPGREPSTPASQGWQGGFEEGKGSTWDPSTVQKPKGRALWRDREQPNSREIINLRPGFSARFPPSRLQSSLQDPGRRPTPRRSWNSCSETFDCPPLPAE